MEYTIYKITCDSQDDDHLYVGATKNFDKRQSQHKHKMVCEDLTKNIKLYTAVRKYQGFNNWTFEAIETCTCDSYLEARIRERYWCEELNADLNMKRPHVSIEEVKFSKMEYAKKHSVDMKEYEKQFTLVHKEDKKEYDNINREHINAKKKEHYIDNRVAILEKAKQYNIDNSVELKAYRKQYYADNTLDLKEKKNSITLITGTCCSHADEKSG